MHLIFHFAVIAPKTEIIASPSFQAIRDQEKKSYITCPPPLFFKAMRLNVPRLAQGHTASL